ncbi:unnamed protein product [Vitrella brassicaformis CCMP3155]|uniref:Ubiquitin-like domain-containing protein n=1 Tax=Vitrella brassicaformis (strain CCMP3155) TaxID=1169540 RepID=A0A0G4EY43_VITBC|nr:unnamed protein product [Vitrella brassicaformis CCMP3155]|eukprot:CEM03656.1 unnamed protein product [Vitrella brassicaformis CCMP3155]
MMRVTFRRDGAENEFVLTENDTRTVDDINNRLRKGQRLDPSAVNTYQGWPDTEGDQLARDVFKDGDVIIYTAGDADGHHVVDIEGSGEMANEPMAVLWGVANGTAALAVLKEYFKPVYMCCLCCEGAMVMAKWLCQACAPAAEAFNQTISNLCGHRSEGSDERERTGRGRVTSRFDALEVTLTLAAQAGIPRSKYVNTLIEGVIAGRHDGSCRDNPTVATAHPKSTQPMRLLITTILLATPMASEYVEEDKKTFLAATVKGLNKELWRGSFCGAVSKKDGDDTEGQAQGDDTEGQAQQRQGGHPAVGQRWPLGGLSRSWPSGC